MLRYKFLCGEVNFQNDLNFTKRLIEKKSQISFELIFQPMTEYRDI
jgi:uncharacterized protein YukJ